MPTYAQTISPDNLLLAMGIFCELHAFLTLFKWCALVPYVPNGSRTRVRRIYRRYLLQILLALLVILVVTYLRATVLNEYSLFLNNLSYVMWLMAAMVDTFVICLILIANGLNALNYETLIETLERIELALDGWIVGQQRRHSDPQYRWLARLSFLLCIVYHLYGFFGNFVGNVHLVLQIRWELMITDLYLCHALLLLYAVGQCAHGLRSMCRDAMDRNDVSELCAVLRLREDLLQCVTLINRIYGVLFMGVSASWLVSITCIVYFDFIYGGLQLNPNHPYALEHSIMLIWKSLLVTGLFGVAGTVADKVKQITQSTQLCSIVSLSNRPLANMIDKLLIKCHFQDIHFTVYGLFTIDNGLNYMIFSSTITYLVIITQFRQLEIENESKVKGSV
uniref:Gustatory receptor n=1 Tax=Anopheles culicifacies TaxID=139723 RepID=A0A182LRC7_9DIPT